MCMHCRLCFITRNRVEADDFSVCLAWHKIFSIPLTTPPQGSGIKIRSDCVKGNKATGLLGTLSYRDVFHLEVISFFADAGADQIGRNKTVARAVSVQVLLEQPCAMPGSLAVGCNYERALIIDIGNEIRKSRGNIFIS